MASREFEGNLYRYVTEADIKKGIRIADDLKIDAELREIFTHIAFSDPSIAAQFGNHSANVIPITTPSTSNLEFATKHSLGYQPVGIFPVLPLIKNYQWVNLVVTKTPDTSYVYLKCATTSASLAIVVW
jgi:hypothetical protein